MLFDIQIHTEWFRVYDERYLSKEKILAVGFQPPWHTASGSQLPPSRQEAGAGARLGSDTRASVVIAHLSPALCTWSYSWHLGCHILTYEATGVKQGRGRGEHLAFTARYMSNQIPLMIGCQAWTGNWSGSEWSAEVKWQRLSGWGLSDRKCSPAGPRARTKAAVTRLGGRQVAVLYPPFPCLQICRSSCSLTFEQIVLMQIGYFALVWVSYVHEDH